MKIKTKVNAGGIHFNHNVTVKRGQIVRDRREVAVGANLNGQRSVP